MLRVLAAGLVALVALVAAPAVQAQAPAPVAAAVAEDGFIPLDPAVRQGVLPNGLRYAILPNPRPAGAASIRLLIKAGSFEEADDERGLAHFLEHMAFNGTRNFAEGELQTRFSDAGLALGRDQNATTGAFGTTYRLDLNIADNARLDLAFAWLSDAADGHIFDPDAIEREKGVVLAERTRSLGPAWDYQTRYQAFMAPGLRGPARRAIGEAEDISRIDAARLTRFRDLWYRPDNAFLVVVGDIDPAAIEARIAAAFGGWSAQGPVGVRASPASLDPARPLDVMVASERRQGSSINICRARPYATKGPDSVARREFYIARALWIAVANRRLARLGQGEDAPFVNASFSTTSWRREADYTCLRLTPRTDRRWREALDAAVVEMRRLETHGVRPDEIERNLAAQRTASLQGVANADARFSGPLADALMNSEAGFELDGAGFISPADSLRLVDLIAPRMTPERVSAAFRADWLGSAPLIAVTLPNPPSERAVRDAWRAAERRAPPAASAAGAVEAWAYTDFGPAAAPVDREEIADPGFTRFRFENGVVLNFKSASFTRNDVQISVRFGDGARELAREDHIPGRFATQFFSMGGLGRHSAMELGDMFPGRRLQQSMALGNDAFILRGVTRPEDLELQLQILAAAFVDPGFRTDFDSARRTAVATIFRQLRAEPAIQGAEAFLKAVAPDSGRSLPPIATAMGWDQTTFRRILSPALAEAPLEITIVGDVEEAVAVGLVGSTFGALPPRPPRDARRPDPGFITFPETLAPVLAVHEGSPERGFVSLTWPLYVGAPERRREQRALSLLRAVLAERVVDEVRERLGASYAPSVALNLQDNADQGAMQIAVETRPDQIAPVRTAIIDVVARIAASDFEPQAVEAARRTILDGAVSQRQTNSWWLVTLDGSARNPQGLQDALEWTDAYQSLTVEEVRAAAARWLTGEPFVVEVRPGVVPVVTPRRR